MKKKQYSQQQPRDGDHILHCGHIDHLNHHFFRIVGDAVTFCRPDRSVDTIQDPWLIICGDCLKQHNDPRMSIRGDSVWVGNEPIVESEETIQ